LIRILVVDDEEAQRQILGEILRDEGYGVEIFASPGDVLARLDASEPADLLLTDLRMPGMSGHDLLREARRRRPELLVVLMTAYATVASAVEAMKDGAFDYLQKPFAREELVQRVRRAAERARLGRENRGLRARITDDARARILGDSPAARRMVATLEKAAASRADVLLTGESGTGKELAARLVHAASDRASGPFVPVNCAAIPASLAESEILGHEKGAFTGAAERRACRFEQADGGTLFLDEVGSMPGELQPKLLRVLQDRVVERVGGGRARRLDLRVIAATNRPLPELVAEGTFRADLHHRLNVLEIELPPLRERVEDVRMLVAAFRDRAADRCGVPPPEVSEEALAILERYAFPGNVRELENLVERMVALSEGEELGPDDLPAVVRGAARREEPAAWSGPVAPEDLLRDGPVAWADLEERLLREAVRRAGGNLSEAARLLGLSYKTLRYRTRKFGIE